MVYKLQNGPDFVIDRKNNMSPYPKGYFNTVVILLARIGKLFSLFLIQNICCGYSKEPSH